LGEREAGGKAVFLDRDGTVNRNTHYLIDFADFELIPGVEDALKILQSLGYRLFGVSNQSGVARGYFPYTAVEDLHRKIIADLAARGIRLEEIAFCPHHPEGIVTEFAKVCECRKPAPGMLRDLARKYALDLSGSFMVGDSESDALAGTNAGAHGVWIHPGAAPLKGHASVDPFGPGEVDNPRKIKEFASLLDFARNLREFA